MTKRRREKNTTPRNEVEVIFPGDWIKYAATESRNSYPSFKTNIGRVIRIEEDGCLIVSIDFARTTRYVPISRVIKKYPRFTVLPISGKVEDGK